MFRFLTLAATLTTVATTPLCAQDIVSDTGHTLTPGVFIQARFRYDSSVAAFHIQRARVTLDGPIAPGFRYHVQAGFEEGVGLLLLDAAIRWRAASFATVTVGQFKTPFAREYVIPLTQLETLDRALVVDALAPRRDIGVMGEFALGSDSLAVAIVNGEGQNALSNKDSALLVVSRFVAHPAKILAVGADVAYYGPDSIRFGADANLEIDSFALRGLYIAQHRSTIAENDFGWSALASYRPVHGLQVVAREEDFERPGISAALKTLQTVVGANVDLSGPAIRFGLNYISRLVGSPGVRSGFLQAQLQARL